VYTKLENWLIKKMIGRPIAHMLDCMPEIRRNNLNAEMKEEAKIQMERLSDMLSSAEEMYERTGMNSEEAHWAAIWDIYGLPSG
jgi:hypothetical protein